MSVWAGGEPVFEAAFEASPTGLLVLDRAGSVLLANAEAAARLGYGAAAQLRGLPVQALLTRAADPQPWAAYFGDQAGPRTRAQLGELCARRQNEVARPLEVALSPLGQGEREAWLCVLSDARAPAPSGTPAELQGFAAMAAHDLKAPLHVIQAYSALLDDGCAEALDARARGYLAHIRGEASRALGLVHDLLAFARIDHARELVCERVDTAGLVRDVLASLAPMGDAGVAVGELPAVQADPGQLRQLFHNLLSNALKFVRPGERACIDVHGTRSGRVVVISVSDRGIGIAGDAPIFEPFVRAPTRTRYEGHGIGLAIVQRVAERHGGRVWYESSPCGSTFYVELPAPP